MEGGEFAYLIFLVLIGLANAYRSWAQKRKEQETVRKVAEYESERPDYEVAEEEVPERGGAKTWKDILEDLRDELEAPDERYDEPERPPKPAFEPDVFESQTYKEPEPRSYQADGFHSGMSMTEYAAMQRQSSRHRFEVDKNWGTDITHPKRHHDFQFDARKAIIYDAIWNAPYLDQSHLLKHGPQQQGRKPE
jgi:hypothetical protein